jgi:hypothetical protein
MKQTHSYRTASGASRYQLPVKRHIRGQENPNRDTARASHKKATN